MDKRLVLGLSGFSGTGKTTIANYLSKRHGFRIFEGSGLMRKLADKRAVTLSSRATYEAFFRQLQREYGLSWIADTMLAAKDSRLLQVGLRSPSDALRIRQAGGAIIALTCPPEICLPRIDTGDPKNPATLQEYMSHQLVESSTDDYGSHTLQVIECADYVIDTYQPIHGTFRAIDDVVDNLLPKSLLLR